MKAKPRRGRSVLFAITGLAVLSVVCWSQSKTSANPAPNAGSLFSAPSGWSEGDHYTGVRMWKGEDVRREYISVIEDDMMKAEMPNPDDKKFVEVIKTMSFLPNWIAGIKDWKAEKIERFKLPEGHKVILTGTYLNSRNELIRFEEWKYFLREGYGQINYSQLAGPKARDRGQVAEILKRYHPFGN